MQIAQRLFILALFSIFYIAGAQALEEKDHDASGVSRNVIIENELQAAAVQARIEAKEQTQENYLKIQNKINKDIGDINEDYKSEESDSKDQKFKPDVKSLIGQEPTQENFQNFQKDAAKDLKKIKSNLGNVKEGFEPLAENPKSDDPRARLKKIEVGLQLESLSYKTDKNFVGEDIRKQGGLIGFYGSYSYHRPYNVPVHSWKDLSRASDGPGVLFTFARFETDLSLGQDSYHTASTGKRTGFGAWQANVRALAGYDFLSEDSSLMVTPYTGLGYRYFVDKTGGFVAAYPNAYVPFENIYSFLYMPLGVETLRHFNEEWDLGFKLEGRIVLLGSDKYSLSSIPGQFDATDADTGLPIVINLKNSTVDLRGGYGFATSSKVIRKYEKYNIFAEPFIGFWYLNKSKQGPIKSHATNGLDYRSSEDVLYEPSNYTLEYGLRLGVQF